jgi:hypothetical protein
MRLNSAFLTVTLLAAPAAAVELIELKNGKVYAVEEARREGDKLYVRLATGADQHAATRIPIDRIVPEFVFYVWARDLPEGKKAPHVELALWARENGLFRHALKVYDAVAEFDEEVRKELPALVQTLREEEATWLFEHAETLFKKDEVKDARVLLDLLLEGFKDSKETGRALELRKMIEEREAFLTEERKRKEADRRTARQRIEMKTQVARIAQGDAYASVADLRYVGEARWQLRWAGYLYEGAAARLSDLLPFVEDEQLRKEVEAHLSTLPGRLVGTYLRLADLRYLCGDLGAALDATHRILDMDPTNAAAVSLRDRIIDGPGPTHIRRDRGFLTHKRRAWSPPAWDGGFGIWRIAR